MDKGFRYRKLLTGGGESPLHKDLAMRNFLTEKEYVALKLWIVRNGFSYEDRRDDNVLFSVIDGRFNFNITETTETGLYEIHDESERQTLKELLNIFYKNQVMLSGIEVPEKKVKKFIPEVFEDCLHHFDHFRICQRQDKLWDILGVIGFYSERLAICDHKLPLKVFGSNFLETYWTLIYTSKKETSV